MHAKEKGGILTSTDGSSAYKTAFTKGGLVADTPGIGKSITAIMHIVNTPNKIDELFRRCGEVPAYKPTVVIVPPSSIDQWINDFRDNAPTVNVLIYWGSRDDRKDSWWTEHPFPAKTSRVVRRRYQNVSSRSLILLIGEGFWAVRASRL